MVKEKRDTWPQSFLFWLTDLGSVENSDERSQLLTREERGEKTKTKHKKGQGLPRQQRHCVKHSHHGD